VIVFLDRGRTSGPYLEWKVRLFTVAAVLAVTGMYLEARWMTGSAILVLAAAMLLRFLRGARGSDGSTEDDLGGS